MKYAAYNSNRSVFNYRLKKEGERSEAVGLRPRLKLFGM